MTDSGDATPAGWYADPSGRHELRWHDGASFTDQVADAGVQSTDAGGDPVPGPDPAPLWAPPNAPNEQQPPPVFVTVTPPKRSRVPVVLCALVVVALLAAAVWFLFGRGDGNGAGTFHATVDGDHAVVAHHIHVPAGSVALVTVTPSEGFDAVVGFTVSRDDADAVERSFRRTGFAEAATSTSVVDGADVPAEENREVFGVDVGFPGEQELTFLAVQDDTDADVVVSGFDPGDGTDPSTGDYDVEIRIVGLDAGAGADGRDFLDAMEHDPDVPQPFVDLVQQTIDPD